MKRNKKIAFILALIVTVLVLLISCGGTVVEEPVDTKDEFLTKLGGNLSGSVSLFEYDGCTYLFGTGSGTSITHHEGCNNLKHERL